MTLIRASKAARHGWHRAVRSRGWALGERERVVLPCLGSEEPFGGGAVTLALAVFFESELDGYGLVHEELAVHGLDGRICGLKVRV